MSTKTCYRLNLVAVVLILALIVSGCASPANSETEPAATSAPATTDEPAPTNVPVDNINSDVLYHDDFTNPASGWPEEKFDNYFIGYHEPEYYHVEISSPNYKTTVFEPDNQIYSDVTIEVNAFTASSKTAETGDYIFGPAFRRSGDQYYVFAISQRAKKWYVLKSTPTELLVLAEGTDEDIHNEDEGDILRVDAQGPNFSFSINDKLVSQVTDADYADGEVGFYVQTFDVTNAHIHFDDLTVRALETSPIANADANALYHDDFTNPASGWPEEKFDNYFIGYHEPEYYHVEISSPNYKTTVFEPDNQIYSDVTIEVNAFTASSKTAETGDYIFGPAFRRSGDQYYVFAISQRAKKWYVLKSTPTELLVLAEGTDEEIHNEDEGDILRVDAQGPNFLFSINDKLVSQVTDADYADGEVGFYVQTFDVTNAHIHFDDLTIRALETQTAGSDNVSLYHDDFTNPASGWPEKKFDNYFIGYHEPEYYHVEISSPNYKTAVFEPDGQIYSDVTIEVNAFTASSKTAETGDYIFGPAFRRSGDQYYVFAISQRAKKWFVLKSTPFELVTLAEGMDEDIHNEDEGDILRVDAQGSNFSFSINDKLVSQVTDSDYADGEVGFYVQTFDVTNAHIHFDELDIQTFEAQLICDVKALTMNVRDGPGTNYSSSTFLSRGDLVEPLGRSEDGDWLLIGLDGNEQGWIINSEGYLSCSASVDILPVTPP